MTEKQKGASAGQKGGFRMMITKKVERTSRKEWREMV